MLVESLRPEAPRQAGHVKRPLIRRAGITDDVANRDAQPVGQSGIETRSLGRRLHHVGIDVPIFGLIEHARFVMA